MQILTRKLIKTVCLILIWYVLSTGLSLYNKQTVGRDQGLFGHVGFPAPLLLSGVQFACQNFLAKFVFWTGWAQRTNNRPMSTSDYFRLVAPNGVASGLDIGLANKSLTFISLSFYTMCKSTVPVFLLFFAFVWGIEKPSLELMGVVTVIVTGLALLVRGEAHFDWLGFGLVMTASCMSGLRFTLTQVLLHGHHSSAALGGPLEVLEQLTPVMAGTALLFSLAGEELWDVLPTSVYFNSVGHTVLTLMAILLGAVIAFLMVWTEYQVIKETSALSFMIAGTVKEVITVLAAVVIMGDELTWNTSLGLVIVIIGVLMFNYHKYRKLQSAPSQEDRKEKLPANDGDSYTAVNACEEEADDDEYGSESEPPQPPQPPPSPPSSKTPHRKHGGSGGGDDFRYNDIGAAAANNGGGVGGTFGTMPSPVSAATVAGNANATAAKGVSSASSSSPLAGSHRGGDDPPASGFLSRAIAKMLNRAPVVEMAPLLASASSGGGGGGHSSRSQFRPTAFTARNLHRDQPEGDRDGNVDGMVVGLGNGGNDPAAAMALSGAGISGPQRGAARQGTRGLLEAMTAMAIPMKAMATATAAENPEQGPCRPMAAMPAELPSQVWNHAADMGRRGPLS